MSVTVSSKFMGPHTIDRRGTTGGTNHSPPPASGDSDDRIDIARRNFEKDPADVRAADDNGDLVAFVSLDVEVMVVEIGDRASSRSEPVLFRAFR